MVLRKFFILCLLLPNLSWSAEPQAVERAQKLAQKNQNVQALRVLELNYNLSSRDLPVKISSFAVSLAMKIQNWRKAERIADAALTAGWPDFKGKSPNLLPVLKMSTEAKTEILTGGDDLTASERKKLKNDIKTYTDVMIANGYEVAVVQDYSQRAQSEAVVRRDEYKLSFSFTAGYGTWEDRPSFDYKLKAKAVLFAPCVGLAANYIGDDYIWSAGACYAQGHADVQFNDGQFDDHGSISMVNGMGSVMMRVSEGGSAYGLEGNWMNATMSGKASGDRKVSAANQDFAFLAVGRYQFYSIDLKFKGGTIVGKPSAMWAFEMSVPVF